MTLVPAAVDADWTGFHLRVQQFAHGRPVVGTYLTLVASGGEARGTVGRCAR